MDDRESLLDLQQKIKSLEQSLTDAKKSLEGSRHEADAYEGLLQLSLSDMRRIYGELLQSQGRLMQADKLATVGLLASGVAHEINHQITVINMVFSLIQMEMKTLETDPSSQSARAGLEEHIRQGYDCADHMTRIVGDLRVFSRSDKAQVSLRDLHELLEGVSRIAWHAMNNVELKKEYGKIPAVRCNGQQMSQVFLNLLVNAAQAIRERGVITIRSFAEKGSVSVEIRDTGAGIPKENLEKIFEPFFTTKSEQDGTGLGLSICRDIVERHGGSIRVKSEEGKGSSFLVTLPLA